jgi:hypothetical protein
MPGTRFEGSKAACSMWTKVAAVLVAVLPGQLVGLGLREVLDALVGLEVVLHPEPLTGAVDPHVGVGGVVAHRVVIAVLCAELEGEAAGVAPGVGRALFTGHGGEPGRHLGASARLEEVGPGELADVVGDFEEAVRTAVYGVCWGACVTSVLLSGESRSLPLRVPQQSTPTPVRRQLLDGV